LMKASILLVRETPMASVARRARVCRVFVAARRRGVAGWVCRVYVFRVYVDSRMRA